MTKPIKDEAYYARMYADCSDGPYCPFRYHSTQFGWGIRHQPTGRIFGYIGSKGECFGVGAALNHKWEAAKSFLRGSLEIPDDYFERFREDGK